MFENKSNKVCPVLSIGTLMRDPSEAPRLMAYCREAECALWDKITGTCGLWKK